MHSFLFDRNQIHQMLINLLENSIYAIEKTEHKGKLQIETKMDECHIFLIISDNSIGIEKKIEAIFNPFYTSKEHGTGLGLTIVFHIINNHDGKIFVDSKFGQYSIFTIQFSRTSPNTKLIKTTKSKNINQ